MSSNQFHPALTNAAQAVAGDNRDEARHNVDWFLSEQVASAQAWLVKAWTVDSLETSIDCFQRALELEPENAIAQAGLTWIQGLTGLADDHLEQERQFRDEQQRLEAERLEQERLEAERLEAERLEQERLEQERLEAERLEAERLEAERLEQERLEAERLEAERLEQERIEAERLEAERLEQERLEQERLEQERFEAERLEAERLEQERLKQERQAVVQAADDTPGEEQDAAPATSVDLLQFVTPQNDPAAVKAFEPGILDQETADPNTVFEQEQTAQAETVEPVSIELEQPESNPEPQANFQSVQDDCHHAPTVVDESADFVIPYFEEGVISIEQLTGQSQLDSVNLSDQNESHPEEQPAEQITAEVQNDDDLEQELSQSVLSLSDEVQHELHSSEPEDTKSAENVDTVGPVEQELDQTSAGVVLAVDDSATIRKLVSLTLREQGYEVITAADGVEALKILAERLPDLVLSDINMPRLGGYKLCKFIKKHERTAAIPVVMLSGKDGVFDKMRGKMSGCDGFIAKPFETGELIRVISHYLPTTTNA